MINEEYCTRIYIHACVALFDKELTRKTTLNHAEFDRYAADHKLGDMKK
jgi:hypothetical protein